MCITDMFVWNYILFIFQNAHLRETLRDYQRQLEAQREQIVQTRGGDQETRGKLSDIRKKLNDALDENIVSLPAVVLSHCYLDQLVNLVSKSAWCTLQQV